MDHEITQEECEAHKNPSEPSRTMISADFTANKVMGRKVALEHLRSGGMVDFTKGTKEKEKTQEELKTFFDDGGEGIDLTFDEACLIYGIAYLFTWHEYPSYIECTEKQLYEALKYEKKISGWQRQRLRKIIEELSLKRFPVYWIENKCRWLTFDSLIKLAWGVRTGESNIEFKTLPTRENFELYRIELNEKLFGRVNKNFRLVDPNIGREIRDYRRKSNRKASKYDIRLYDLLLHKNESVIKRNYLKIAQAPMLMDNMIKNRKQRDIRDKLNDIYEMYYHMGYLTNFEIDQIGTRYKVDVLYLNPEKFYQLQDVKK